MVIALNRVPGRKFTYVEQAYFQRWWRQQNDHMKNITRQLVHDKRLEFANGGWCMHVSHSRHTPTPLTRPIPNTHTHITQLARHCIFSAPTSLPLSLCCCSALCCAQDEATTHYIDMIDQTTLGHQYIRSEFGESANPKIGWQLDPFGHSATQAWLLSAEAGFDALFFGRIDYQDHDVRVANKDLQYVWAPSASRPHSAVYTEASLDGNCWTARHTMQRKV